MKQLWFGIGAMMLNILAVLPAQAGAQGPEIQQAIALRAELSNTGDRLLLVLPRGLHGHGHLSNRKVLKLTALDRDGQVIGVASRTISKRTSNVSFDLRGFGRPLEEMSQLVLN